VSVMLLGRVREDDELLEMDAKSTGAKDQSSPTHGVVALLLVVEEVVIEARFP
jgi:hypothetical protein